MAIAEMYGLSGDQVLKPIADKAVEYLLNKQFKGSGWGNGDADLLTTAWCVTALKSAKMAGLEFDATAAHKDAQKFLDLMLVTRGGYPFPRYSLLSEQPPGSTGKLPLNEAAWVISSLLTGQRDINDKDIKMLARTLTEKEYLPAWEEGKLDFQYWYFATLATYQVGGTTWDNWVKPLFSTLTEHQRGYHKLDKDAGLTDSTRLDEHGSWDAVDVWSPLYGRVYSTAINSLNMEIYYRYQRLMAKDSPKPKDPDDDAIEDAQEFVKAQAFVPDSDCGGLRARSGGVVIGDFPLARTSVSASVSGNVAGTTVTQTFTNPYTQPIEAMYTFPLPTDSAINDFVMKIGKRRIIGVVRPREEALAIYKEARARGQTASLLTQNRPNVFTQSVANIEVGGEVKVTITYYQSLKYEDGRYEYVFPLTLGERYKSSEAAGPGSRDGDGVEDPEDFDVRTLPQGQRSGMDIELTVDIDAGIPIDVARLRSLQHGILVNMTGAGRAIVELSRQDAIPNRDFVLRWGFAAEKPAVALHTHSDSRGNFLNLQLQPQLDPADADVTPRELTFILDNSGSMSGAPSQMSKQLISRVLDHLHPDDTFNIVYFSGSNGQVFERPAANTPANLEKAREYLKQVNAGGGTEMLAGLERALKAEHDPRHLQIYAFLTDGNIGRETDILNTIRDEGQAARFFAFGVGSSVNRYLIDGIAEHGKGKAFYCMPRDSGYEDAAVQELYDAIDRPVLCDIEIDWNGLQVDEAYPSKLNDLFATRPLNLMARYSGGGKHTIHVRGRVGAHHVDYPVELDLSRPDANPAIATIWARHKISDLEGRLLGNPGDPALIGDITQTALDYNLMSAYTSFVAVDESRVVGDGQPLRVWQPVEMPENVLYVGQDVAQGDETFRIGSWGLVVGQTSDGRVIVVKVEDGGAAADAGMRPGQILKKINGTSVGDLAKLEKLLLQSEAKVDVETSVTDDGKEFEAAFKLPQAGAEKTK
jgi:Ca-activated chloride channel family protein